jgi:protein TonB
MFEQSLVERTGTKYAVLASLLLQCAMVGLLALAPLLFLSPLPARQLWSYLAGPPAPPQRSTSTVRPRSGRAPQPRFDRALLLEPARIPVRAAILHDEEEGPDSPALGHLGEGVPGGVPPVGIMPLTQPPAPAPLPAARPVPPVTVQPLKVGGDVQKAKLIYGPIPGYPPLARQQRISGVVRLNAAIAKDGTVRELHAAAGHPLLVPAALGAVSQWRYHPTLLNGDPVEVITQVDVHFTLQ